MQEIIEIIKQLQNTSGTNDKLAILKSNKENELLKRVLYYTYNPFKKYKITEKIINPDSSSGSSYLTIFELLDTLSQSNINDLLRQHVNKFLGNFQYNEDLYELYKMMLLKDLRINLGVKTINKVWKGLIPEWNVQQAYSIDKIKLKKDEWFALSLKLNGIRSTYYVDGFKTRQNKEMLGFNHVENDLKLLGINNLVVDGEMIRNNIDNIPDNENFRLTTSIVNSNSANKESIQMIVFDIIPKDEFDKGESRLGFKDRLSQLNMIASDIERLQLKNVRVAPTYYVGTDTDMINILLDEVDNKGYEGLMLLRDIPYKCKRHNGIAKCKKFKTADCEIVGYEEGTGRLEGTLGSFIIEYKGNKVNVGSGYSDEQRQLMWQYRDEYIGKILEVKFKEESMDSKTKLISLQFPTFVCIREEGKEVSYN